MTRSAPINTHASRRDVLVATLAVWRAGPRAAGVDHATFKKVFGTGPGSPEFIRTANRLCHYRHAYQFSATRAVKVENELSGKVRTFQIPTYYDRIIFRVLANKLAISVPRSRVDWCRPGVDSRASVVALAQQVRRHPEPFEPGYKSARTLLLKPEPWRALHIDLANAFPSLNWKVVLESPAAKKCLPEPLRTVLAEVYGFYSPTGIGVPLGLATSPAMLQLALADADGYLLSLGVPVFRYLDDVAVLVPDSARADKILEGFATRITPFELSISSTKSGVCRGAIPWLGHSLDMRDGTIDIGTQAALRLEVLVRAADDSDLRRIVQALDHFGLATCGKNFQRILHIIKEHWGNRLCLAAQDPQLVDHAGQEPVLPTRNAGREKPTTTRNGFGSTQYGSNRVCRLGRNGYNHRVASEQHSPARSVTETDHVVGKPSCRRQCGGRQGGSRRPPEIVNLLGGHTQLLNAADELASAIAQRHTELEAKVLFGSLDKAKQYARAHQVWAQVLAVFQRQARLLTPAQEEALLMREMPVLLTAATLTVVDSSWVCRADPLKVILQHIGGKPTKVCKAELVAERRSRENGERPTRKSMFAELLMGHTIAPAPVEDMAPLYQNARAAFLASRRNKKVGSAEEARVAKQIGGHRTRASGAGVVKGDVYTDKMRIEIKTTRAGRWLLPLYQLDQLRRSGKLPVVTFTAHGKTVLCLAPESWVDQSRIKVVASRGSQPGQGKLSISRPRVLELLAEKNTAVRCDLGQHGVWLLITADTFMEVVAP